MYVLFYNLIPISLLLLRKFFANWLKARNVNKTNNVRTKVTLRRVRETIVAVENQ